MNALKLHVEQQTQELDTLHIELQQATYGLKNVETQVQEAKQKLSEQEQTKEDSCAAIKLAYQAAETMVEQFSQALLQKDRECANIKQTCEQIQDTHQSITNKWEMANNTIKSLQSEVYHLQVSCVSYYTQFRRKSWYYKPRHTKVRWQNYLLNT